MEKFLFITDLDATLLEHDYSYDAARPALDLIREKNAPLVLNSSKTIAELSALASELKLTSPIIAENGGAVGVHKNSILEKKNDALTMGDYLVNSTGMGRAFILEKAHTIRSEYQFHFEGFDDWSDIQLSQITKLTPEAANLAKQRAATEPILWHDTEERFAEFEGLLLQLDIQIVRGGKFRHLMGKIDKANGASYTANLYKRAYPETEWTVVALGDSENDLKMLEQADIACVIPHDGEIRIRPQHSNTIYATHNASAGWNECIQQIFN